MTGIARIFATVAISLTACAGPPAAEEAARQKPNIVVILADDQGWGDLSIHGNTNLATPNIDSLARDGALFEHFYVSPVCSPTRAEFLTGRYAARGGVRGVSTGEERLNLDEHTIAETFKAAGYATGAFGKWHNGTQHPYHPNARGFDEYYGFTEGHWGQYFDYELDHNGTLVRGEGYLIDDFTNHALEFIEEHRGQPFFAYLPYNTPHSPMQAPDAYWDRFKDKPIAMTNRDAGLEDIPFTRAALAMVENIDWNVGRVFAKLDELGLRENTIVLYFSDNGPNSWRWNGGMKGRKGSLDEGGVRAPFLIRWPGEIAAGRRITQIAAAIDLLPTLADLAGVSVASQKPLDGKSLRPLLTAAEGEHAATWPDRTLFTVWRNRISARSQTHRLDAAGRLYDLETDPGQDSDISKENPELANKLKTAAAKLAGEIAAEWGAEATETLARARSAKPEPSGDGPAPQTTLPFPPDDRPFPVGYATTTRLPARDGVPHGGIERSASAPNCSYFTNWTGTQDRITWDIEVSATADYEVQIYYTVPAADVGSTLEVKFQPAAPGTAPAAVPASDLAANPAAKPGAASGSTDQPINRVTAKITEAHDPPLYGRADDRTPRTQSEVKDFKPMTLGTLSLPEGRGEVSLQATGIPGRSVADIRYLVLTRK